MCVGACPGTLRTSAKEGRLFALRESTQEWEKQTHKLLAAGSMSRGWACKGEDFTRGDGELNLLKEWGFPGGKEGGGCSLHQILEVWTGTVRWENESA